MPKKKQWKLDYTFYESEAEMPEIELNLWNQAKKACDKSYSPYSNFGVGAAILLRNGEVVLGANQENAAYPSGLCAERVAFFTCGVQFPMEEIQMIAVIARKANTTFFVPAAPCGACRQVMSEYEDKQQKPIALLFQTGANGVFKINAVADLLPFKFGSEHLK
jgi:cytidine deaminase